MESVGTRPARSSRNAQMSYSSHVTSVLPIQNGPTETVRGPCGVSSVTVPPGTGIISKLTSVPGIESRYGKKWAADWPTTAAGHAANSNADIRLRNMTALGFVLIAGTVALPTQAVRREYIELHMGVAVRVVGYAVDDGTARRAARAAYARIAELEEIMSDYRPQSEVRRLTGRTGADVPVSEPLYAVLARALELARLSDGAFDPTVGP